MPTPADKAKHDVLRLPHLNRAKDISVGANHGVALLEDGTIGTWGDNSSGQLGRETPASQGDGFGLVPGVSGVIAVRTSLDHHQSSS